MNFLGAMEKLGDLGKAKRVPRAPRRQLVRKGQDKGESYVIDPSGQCDQGYISKITKGAAVPGGVTPTYQTCTRVCRFKSKVKDKCPADAPYCGHGIKPNTQPPQSWPWCCSDKSKSGAPCQEASGSGKNKISPSDEKGIRQAMGIVLGLMALPSKYRKLMPPPNARASNGSMFFPPDVTQETRSPATKVNGINQGQAYDYSSAFAGEVKSALLKLFGTDISKAASASELKVQVDLPQGFDKEALKQKGYAWWSEANTAGFGTGLSGRPMGTTYKNRYELLDSVDNMSKVLGHMGLDAAATEIGDAIYNTQLAAGDTALRLEDIVGSAYGSTNLAVEDALNSLDEASRPKLQKVGIILAAVAAAAAAQQAKAYLKALKDNLTAANKAVFAPEIKKAQQMSKGVRPKGYSLDQLNYHIIDYVDFNGYPQPATGPSSSMSGLIEGMDSGTRDMMIGLAVVGGLWWLLSRDR